jgi:hypothetical protein
MPEICIAKIKIQDTDVQFNHDNYLDTHTVNIHRYGPWELRHFSVYSYSVSF